MNLNERKQRLQLVCSGSNPEYFYENANTDILFSLSDHQQERIERALSEHIQIFPITTSIYMIISIKEEQNEENTTYMTNTRVQSCTCSDFLYRCDYQNGERCKHLWRITLLSKLNALPPKDIHPSRWMYTEIEKDRLLIESSGYTELADELQQLQELVLQHKPKRDNSYESFFRSWYSIIKQY